MNNVRVMDSARQTLGWRTVFAAIGGVVAMVVPLVGGCGDSVDVGRHAQLQQQTVQQQVVDELFNRGIGLLADVEHAESNDLIDQAINSLNQWSDNLRPLDDWQLDPLTSTLSDALHQSRPFSELKSLEFRRGDGFALLEALWLKHAGRHVAGKLSDPLAKAEALFAWVAMQVALEDEPKPAIPHQVWETILRGRGTQLDRLWTLMLAARQQGLDVVGLMVERDGTLVPWVAALWHQRQLYLFDNALGVPLRNAAGQIATLAEVQAQPELLSALASNDEQPYRVSTNDLERLVAVVEGSPPYLAQRFRQIELRLVGEQRLTLSLDASALVDELKSAAGVLDVRLWTLPWERTVAIAQADPALIAARGDEIRPFRVPEALLWKGRVLHLMGRTTGELSAVSFYQQCRPTSDELELLKKTTNTSFADLQRAVPIAKQDATYWLGLVSFERGNYATAIDYWQKRLLAPEPTTRWKSAAEYMIARAHEAAGDRAAAEAAYRRVTGPAAESALVRARLLTAKP